MDDTYHYPPELFELRTYRDEVGRARPAYEDDATTDPYCPNCRTQCTRIQLTEDLETREGWDRGAKTANRLGGPMPPVVRWLPAVRLMNPFPHSKYPSCRFGWLYAASVPYVVLAAVEITLLALLWRSFETACGSFGLLTSWQ